MTAGSDVERAPDASVGVARDDIDRAVAAGLIQADQADALWDFLRVKAVAQQPAIRPRFDLVHLLWYAGALIVISAMGLFATLAFAQLGGAALAVIAVIYAVILAIAGDRLWRRGLLIPGGLLLTIAVTMAPMFVYGVQEALGWLDVATRDYRDFYEFCRVARGSSVPLELATVVAGLIALRLPWHFGRSRWTWRRGSSATRPSRGGCASWFRSGSGLA
jgi:hypothetical protein